MVETTLYLGDCLDVMKSIPDKSVDAVIADPPYEIGFMGKSWDNTGIANNKDMWREVLRVLKPGGHLLSFGGTRTYHRMACAIEDAGFEIRDQIQWIYGSGFPKSMNIGKAIEANIKTGSSSPKAQRITAMGDEYSPSPLAGTPGYGTTGNFVNKNTNSKEMIISSDEALRWDGWGTALKPANEPIVLARKPIEEKTVAGNVLKWGTGGINIDGCRVEGIVTTNPLIRNAKGFESNGLVQGEIPNGSVVSSGRFPANVIHDGSDEVTELFPVSNGGAFPKKSNVPTGKHYEGGWGCVNNAERTEFGSGSAARFFYCAKASRTERNAGLEGMEAHTWKEQGFRDNESTHLSPRAGAGRLSPMQNHHPTVKPIALMRYLCKLITPPGGIVLDPFMGSGTTGCAAELEGFNFIGIEQNPEYMAIAEKRIKEAQQQMRLEL